MKLFVIGATGRTGREIVEQALARGHHVTAFVRSPEGIKLKNERLAVIKGNAMDENQLGNAMQDHDAVVSTLGPRQVFKPTSMLHDSAVSTTRAMQRSEVKRLVVLSAAAHFPGIPNRILSFILRNHMRDSLRMEEIVQASGLDWTIALSSTSHPAGLYRLSQSGRRCAQDGFHCLPQSSCGIHARSDRAKETFSENCGHREIILGGRHVHRLRRFHCPRRCGPAIGSSFRPCLRPCYDRPLVRGLIKAGFRRTTKKRRNGPEHNTYSCRTPYRDAVPGHQAFDYFARHVHAPLPENATIA